ncbi:hypothetical protein FDECE_14565 [Fusarium decemcellulare]|nr:hypothetical protein FDECE_14565 [Fusarium decemcellulare]
MATDDTNDDSGFSLTDRPFAWVLIPLIVILFIGLVATIIQVRRRRRRRTAQWPGHGPRVLAPSGRLFGPAGARRTTRGAPWNGTRSEEGLNELGEAPPPYDGKKERQDGAELQDLEAGSPPEYPAVPGPAVTTESRRP